MRLLICAGGTGGGVYPALTVLNELKGKGERLNLETLWVGGIGGMEADLIQREGIAYQAIPAAGIVGAGKALPRNLWLLGQGFLAARKILNKFRPDVLLFTGGFLAIPVALAARLPGLAFQRPRSLLYVPDIEPALALKSLVRTADGIAVSAQDSLAYYPDPRRVRVTGYPTRQGLRAWAQKGRYEARSMLGLSSDLPVVLVTGGSRGARPINRVVMDILPGLLTQAQVVHITGNLDWPDINAAWERLAVELGAEQSGRYHVYPYLHEEMGAALAGADLVLSRSGASVLGEYPLFGLPAVLVPYPYSWRYQQGNARHLERSGAAVILQEGDLPENLLPTLERLLGDQSVLEKMRAAMNSLARPEAAEAIASTLVELAEHQGREPNG